MAASSRPGTDRAPIRPQPGNERDPANFVGREEPTRLARERLLAGDNLWLSDPRRIGKTYWMRTFAAREAGFQGYLINYEGVTSVDQFLTRTAEELHGSRKLPDRTRRVLSTVFENVESVGMPGVIIVKPYHRRTPPLTLLTSILSALDTDDGPVPLVMMDEVPMAIRNIARSEDAPAAAALLQTLRALRQGTTRVRWIVAGSVGFHHVLRDAGGASGDLADLASLVLGPLPDHETRELAQRLLLGINQTPSDRTVEALVEVSGGIPFLAHKVVGMLGQRNKGTATARDVRDCFEDFIDCHEEFGWFDHFTRRVDQYYGDRTRLAQKTLDSAVSSEHQWVPLASLDAAVLDVLDDLVADHYLEVSGQRVRWRYPALQYIWARRRRLWDRP